MECKKKSPWLPNAGRTLGTGRREYEKVIPFQAFGAEMQRCNPKGWWFHMHSKVVLFYIFTLKFPLRFPTSDQYYFWV